MRNLFASVCGRRFLKSSRCRQYLRSMSSKSMKASHAMSDYDYTQWDQHHLISRINDLERRLRNRNEESNSKKTESSASPNIRSKKKSTRTYDPSKYSTRFIALKFAYLGGRYNGYEHHANNSTPLPTIEEELWKALTKTRLISPPGYDAKGTKSVCWDKCDYSKCGRTDKGVSAYGQVIGIRVRSNRPLPKNLVHTNSEFSSGDTITAQSQLVDHGPSRTLSAGATNDASKQRNDDINSDCRKDFDDVKDEISYIRTLNRVLPEDIRILAWCPSPPPGFDARFSCKERHYKYFFSQPSFSPIPGNNGLYGNVGGGFSRTGWLDIEAMREAASHLVGLHDFRNFCKIDPAKQITNFKRRIFHASIDECEPNNSPLNYVYRKNFVPPSPTKSGLSSIKAFESLHRQNDENDKLGETYADRRYTDLCSSPKIYSFNIRGSAFLWHQVRHLVAILFLVGQSYEKPTIIKDLLTVSETQGKPMYELAAAEPLVLYNCSFAENNHSRTMNDLNWVYSTKGRDNAKNENQKFEPFARNEVVDSLWRLWQRRKVDEVLCANMLGAAATPRLDLLNDNCNEVNDSKRSYDVYSGSDHLKPVEEYVPVNKLRRMDDPATINARYVDKKNSASSVNEDADE